MLRILATLTAIAATSAAGAQIALPPVQLPELPSVQLPVDVGKTVSDATTAIEPEQLVQLRALRIRELLRTHRDLIEADPHGEPIVRAELLAFSPSSAALEQAQAAGFSVTRERTLEGLAAKILVLRAPAGMPTRRALKRLKALDPQGAYDFNHIYTDSGFVSNTSTVEESHGIPVPTPRSESRAGFAGLDSGAGIQDIAQDSRLRSSRRLALRGNDKKLEIPLPQAGLKIGLIDGGVDISHPVFQGQTSHQYGCSNKPVISAHGTAVASLMTGRSGKFHSAVPDAELYAADVYCGLPTGGAVDAVADAFGWMSRERVAVVNVSLVGPPNTLLENVIRLMIARGHIIVAAVGNDGPNSPPLYPAAYADVVGVTAVDARRRVLLEAVRGRQVDFAAPGIGVAAASIVQPSASARRISAAAAEKHATPAAAVAEGSYASVRGTSFAAPITAGLLATEMREPNKAAANKAIAHLAAQAIDLGPRGLDTTYGNGLVGDSLLQ